MKPQQIRLTRLGGVLATIASVGAGVWLYWFVTMIAWPLTRFAIETFDAWKLPALLVAAGLLLAVMLCVMRVNSPRLYGSIEVVIASFGLAATVWTHAQQHPAAAAIGFLGSIYVAVRGFTNIWESISKATQRRIRDVFFEAEAK